MAYPRAWLLEYSDRQYLLQDPVVDWALANRGLIDWSELRDVDEVGVFEHAKAFGLRHGFSVSKQFDNTITVGCFARPDREFTALEKGVIDARFGEFLALLRKVEESGSEEIERLRELSTAISTSGLEGMTANTQAHELH